MKSFKLPLISFVGVALFGLFADFALDAYIQLLILYSMVNILLAMSLNFVSGYTGQFSLGHAGFMSVGAYFSAYASMHWQIFPESLGFLNFFFYTLGAGLTAAFAGFLVGQPSLRLKGDYLAIVTLGFGEIIRVAILNIDSLGAARGIAGIPSMGSYLKNYSFGGFWIVVCFFTMWRLLNSRHGRAFLSVREDEIAAESMGINTTQMKVKAFILSSFFAGIAGALFAHYINFINPQRFDFQQSVAVVIMVVLGGLGSMSGSICAAIFVTVLPELLRPLQEITGVDLRMVIYSLILIIVMLIRPQGLLGGKELNQVWRKYVKRAS